MKCYNTSLEAGRIDDRAQDNRELYGAERAAVVRDGRVVAKNNNVAGRHPEWGVFAFCCFEELFHAFEFLRFFKGQRFAGKSENPFDKDFFVALNKHNVTTLPM